MGLSDWDMTSAISVNQMFRANNMKFNPDISRWDTSKVTGSVHWMFVGAKQFDQSTIDSWDLSAAKDVATIFG